MMPPMRTKMPLINRVAQRGGEKLLEDLDR